MNPETEAILTALMESRKLVEAKLDALDAKLQTVDSKLQTMDSKLQTMDSKLHTVAADVVEIKERLTDMEAIDRHLGHKTADLEAELSVVKRRLKA